jgi:hypothetical protein
MTQTVYQILYWRQIPLQVKARAGGSRERAAVQLSERFQKAADEAAMRAGMNSTDAYLQEMRQGPWVEAEGDPGAVARQIGQQLEAEYTDERLAALVRGAEMGGEEH